MPAGKKQILLTNDDGILSPGIWAAAEALSAIGFVSVVAPRVQYSSAGRSFPNSSDGRIEERLMQVHGQEWKVYAVGGSPAQTVQHALLEILPQPPDLVVSGINYGENVGTGITVSGTVGAAFEAAACGIPALAVSMQLAVIEDYLSYSKEVDFSAAAYFTRLVAAMMLANPLPADVDILKVEVPLGASAATPWHMTRQSRHRYYSALPIQRSDWDQPAKISVEIDVKPQDVEPDSDVHALLFGKFVSVTPLSIDSTSRVALPDLEARLKASAA